MTSRNKGILFSDWTMQADRAFVCPGISTQMHLWALTLSLFPPQGRQTLVTRAHTRSSPVLLPNTSTSEPEEEGGWVSSWSFWARGQRPRGHWWFGLVWSDWGHVGLFQHVSRIETTSLQPTLTPESQNPPRFVAVTGPIIFSVSQCVVTTVMSSRGLPRHKMKSFNVLFCSNQQFKTQRYSF